MRNWIILLLILLTATAGYGWYWYHQASEFRAKVEESFTQFQAKAVQTNSRVTITHGPLSVAGFPFQYRTEMRDLVVKVDDITRALTLNVERVTVLSNAPDHSAFNIIVPKRFGLEMLRSDIRESYDISLSEPPNVMVSLVNKGEKPGTQTSPKRFAAVFPKSLILSFQLNDLKRDIAFDLAMMQLPIWQNMRYDVGPSLSFFYDILAEGAARTQ